VAGPTNICAFLDTVPLEVRLEIYGYLLIDRTLGSGAPFHKSTQREVPDESDESESEHSSGGAENDGNGQGSDSNNQLDNTDGPDAAGEDSDDSEELDDSENAYNPEGLGNPQPAPEGIVIGEYGVPVLNLSCAILLTCRKIYDEASSVLYDSNTFALRLSKSERGQSVLMRNKDRKWRFPESWDAGICPAFSRIKSWRIFIDPSLYLRRHPAPPAGLLNFCWAFNRTGAHELQVCVVRHKVKLLEGSLHTQHASIAKVLRPLDLLRGLTRLDITEVNRNGSVLLDLRDVLETYAQWPGNPASPKRVSIIGARMCMDIANLTRGDSPIMYLFRPLRALVQYGLAFDSDERYKVGVFRQFQHYLVMPYDDARIWVGELERVPMPIHAMQILLPPAYRACLVNDTQDFRNARFALVEAVESQYRRMMAASEQMAEYSDELRSLALAGGRRNLYRDEICLSAHRHIRQWTADFERDVIMPFSRDPLTRGGVLPGVDMDSRRREKILKKLLVQSSKLGSIIRCKKFLCLVKKLANHLLRQFLEARRYRETLYDGDRVMDPDECEFDLGKVDQLVDWSIKKPDRVEFSTQDVGFFEEDEALDEEPDNLMMYLPFRPRFSTG
jgi:hypothetical protein